MTKRPLFDKKKDQGDLAVLLDVSHHSRPLGATVAGSVACGWIAEWTAAGDAGDAVAAERAADVMAGSHDWQVLVDMNQDGAYPEVLWELADAMVTDGSGVRWQTHDRAGVVLRQPRARTYVAVTPAPSRSRRWP